jgi:hypothetical protein
MTIKGIRILITPFKCCINEIVSSVATNGIRFHTEGRSPLNTLLSMFSKLLDTPSCQFLGKVAFATQIFGSNFRTGQVDAILKRVHGGATHVDGMNEFVNDAFMRVRFTADVILTDEDLWY